MLRLGWITCLLICMTGFHLRAARPETSWKIGLVQASLAWGDVDKNLSGFHDRVKKCKGCHLIVLPELFPSGCLMKKRDKEAARAEKQRIASAYERVVDSLLVWAREQEAVVMGSTIYAEDGKFFNRLVAAFPDGTFRHYDKHNCFKMGGYTPGDKQLVFEYKGMKIATYICYDLRFPEWSRNTAGYDMAVYVANWPESRHADWLALLKERAVENRAVVIGVNCTGTDPHGLQYRGGSLVVDALGKIQGKCDDFTDEVKIVPISFPSR